MKNHGLGMNSDKICENSTTYQITNRCLLTTIADSNPANVIFGKSHSGNHGVSSEYLSFFFVQPLLCAHNFCIGIFHVKFDLFI